MKCKYLLLGAAVLLAACGDDSSSGPAPENTPNSSAIAPLSSSDGGNTSAVSSSSATVGEESSSSAKVTTASSSSVASSSSAVKGSIPANYDAATNTVTDERDGKKYKTVTIGTQTWFAQNLAYDVAHDNGLFAYKCPNNEESNCEVYGYLYNQRCFADAVDRGTLYPAFPESVRPFKGVCPTGWHIPSIKEWQVLLDNVAVRDLLAESAGGTGKSGFDILLAGDYSYSFGAVLFGLSGNFATVDEKQEGYMYYAKFTSTSVSASVIDRDVYISVRCLMD